MIAAAAVALSLALLVVGIAGVGVFALLLSAHGEDRGGR